MLRTFLKRTKHNEYYEDINYLYSYYTGNSCPKISEYETRLLADFDKLIEAFDKLVQKGEIESRSSFLNTQYILYQLLSRHGYKCIDEDFNLLKREKLMEHDDNYLKICQVVGFDFVPMI